MSKILVYVTLIKNNKKIYDNVKYKGIKNDNRIIYKENDITVTLSIFDDYINMERKTIDYLINFDFKENCETKCAYNIKKYGNVDLNLFTKEIVIKDYIKILYYINEQDENYEFKLSYEVK